MDIVCASPCAHQYSAVQYMRRSFASGSRWDPPSTGGRLRDIVYWVMVEYRVGDGIAYNFHWRLDRTPIHPRRVFPHPRISTLMDAPTSNRRRMTASAAPERSPADLDGAILVRTRTCTNSTHQIPHIKVLRSFFKSDRSPSVSPPFPRPQKLKDYIK